MSQAKKCDRCKNFYEEKDTSSMPYLIKAIHNPEFDMCLNCLYELEEFVEHPKTKEKKLRKESNWSEEKLEGARQRQAERTEIAKLMQDIYKLEWRDAFQKGCFRIHQAKEQGVSIEELKKSIERSNADNLKKSKPSILCPMCEKVKVEKEGKMCEECEENWNDYVKHK
jgi:hypothetical protein